MTKNTKVRVSKRGAKRRAKAPPPMAVSAFAKLVGVSPRAVSKAIQSGRLEDSIVTVKGKPKIADVELAREEWKANTRGKSDAPNVVDDDDQVDDSAMSFNEARRNREIETWKLARVKRRAEELNLAERRGELISVEDARETVIAEYTSLKTKLLGLSTRVRQRLQDLSNDDVRTIDDLIREALESLSDGE